MNNKNFIFCFFISNIFIVIKCNNLFNFYIITFTIAWFYSSNYIIRCVILLFIINNQLTDHTLNSFVTLGKLPKLFPEKMLKDWGCFLFHQNSWTCINLHQVPSKNGGWCSLIAIKWKASLVPWFPKQKRWVLEFIYMFYLIIYF